MTNDDPLATVRAVAERHTELVRLLTEANPAELTRPSLLPDWDRLTIVCHLRYGAEASLNVTTAALAGREAAFYPGGRDTVRPSTLSPRPGESAADVVASFVNACRELDALWQELTSEQWTLLAREPRDNADLGPVALSTLALLRLTEVEVHGSDLDIDAAPWSQTFVDQALPMRLRWLPTRRSNNAPVDNSVTGTWILRPHDGAPYAITIDESVVQVVEGETNGRAELVGSKRDLLAFLLGRLGLADLTVHGDAAFAASFHRAFPTP